MLRTESALTELKETQVQLVQHERLAVVGELAAGVAHEANNPLNFATNAMRAFLSSLEDVEAVAHEIVGLRDGAAADASSTLEKLRRTCEERDFDDSLESLRELAVIIDEGLARTARLVGDLRDFAGRRSSDHETVDLRAGVESTVQLMSQALRDADIEIEVCADADLPFVVGDARALNQVVLNLLKNAMHAMQGRGGAIHIEMTGSDDEAVIRVRDEGRGIPEEIRGEIFEPFRTTKRGGEGTGLGLSISRRILAEHGGRLDLLESSAQGTTFELRIPVED
jgi:signal transduction histidine kinase